jgi:hypothetical protein
VGLVEEKLKKQAGEWLRDESGSPKLANRFAIDRF